MNEYSNSPLVKYVKLSPHNSGLRNHKIDTITIHCVVGHVTLESLGEIFFNPQRYASSNYGVDDSGNVGMYCEEKNRSWCTSSSENDNRAVTMEVMSDKTAPYIITDSALRGVIRLCADICKRNDIKKLLWKADKNLIGQVDKQNVTAHRWFAQTSCPGDYIYGKMGYIVDEVNKLLNQTNSQESPVIQPVVVVPTVVAPVKENTEKIIWDFLKSKKLNNFAIAGIMGNLYGESKLNSKNLQESFEKKLKHTDESYTAAVDSGVYTNFIKDGAGYGLAQWTFWNRKKGLLDLANAKKTSIGDLSTQLEYLWTELCKYQNTMSILKNAKSIQEASNIVLLDYERPANKGIEVQMLRVKYSTLFYNMFVNNGSSSQQADGTSFKPYLVRIIASEVSYHSGPGTNYKVSGKVVKNQAFTIVGESSGPGALLWGKLKSGAGWLPLDFCKRL